MYSCSMLNKKNQIILVIMLCPSINHTSQLRTASSGAQQVIIYDYVNYLAHVEVF